MYLFSGCRLLQARSQFKSRSTANNVEILVPVPSDADSPKFKTSTGSAKWVPEKSAVQWNIKSFPVSGKCKIFNSFWFLIFICVLTAGFMLLVCLALMSLFEVLFGSLSSSDSSFCYEE